jgi:pilus assembly protein CpaF
MNGNDLASRLDLQAQVSRVLIDELALRPTIDLADRASRLADEFHPLLPTTTRDAIASAVVADLTGLGPLQRFLDEPGSSEVMVTGPSRVWVEREGHMFFYECPELTDTVIMRIIERVIAPLGLVINRASPTVDARLADGSRLNAVIPPLAIDGPYVTIRRFTPTQFALSDFCDQPLAVLLGEMVCTHRNIVVSGGTGSGKTSLLNTLGTLIMPDERVITIEDAAELRLPGRHVVRLEARPGSLDGTGRITIRDLVRNALRMRPDRLIVGEVRGAEALDMIQALNTGHAGSMTTLHANSAIDALRRLEVMVLMAGLELPLAAVRQQLGSALDVIVHVDRDGPRRVVREVVQVADVLDSEKAGPLTP